jgi:flagellar biosynthesis protein FlhG
MKGKRRIRQDVHKRFYGVKMSRIITVTSGKGGVGKTNLSVNLALYLADEGYRTCLFDADMGLANVDILLGLYPDLSLEDVILERKGIDEIIIKDFMGIDIVPGSSGIQRMADPGPEELNLLISALSELEDYDFLIVDTSAGISKSVISFCMASSEIMLVVTSEPTSLTDAYSLLKVLTLNGFNGSVMVAVNQCKSIEISGMIFSKFKAAVEKYLPLKILPAGTILADEHIPDSVKKQKPFISLFPNSDAAKGVKNIGRHLIKRDRSEFDEYAPEAFWARCFKLFTGALQLTGTRTARGKQVSENPNVEKPEAPPVRPEKGQNQGMAGLPLQVKNPCVNQETADKAVPHPDVPVLLEKLVHGISDISSELSAIRGILEKSFMVKRREQ